MTFEAPEAWTTASADPNDGTFGDVIEAASPADLSAYAAAIVGQPFDRGVLGRGGAGAGPVAIRESLRGVKTHHFDAGPVGAVADLGDVTVGEGVDSVRELQAAVADAMATVHDAPTLPVALGGDNSLTYANVAPLLDDGETVGVVNLDAHLDCRAIPESDPNSGTPYRQLFADGLDALAVVGARHFETSTAYHDYLRERGGEVVTAEEVGDDPVDAADRAHSAVDEVDCLYVSVDLDVLDAAAAPGVSAPTPGGLSTRELFRVLRLLAGDDRLAGVEVVECSPPLDSGGRTSDAAARAVAHALAAHGVSGGDAR